ncbi:hypothetical protein AHIS1_p035 [Acaryochloris phage A-HIS1]|nr:hypothetical protein AHIS1_p035 [Acaryochloris phage A-HIS1]
MYKNFIRNPLAVHYYNRTKTVQSLPKSVRNALYNGRDR